MKNAMQLKAIMKKLSKEKKISAQLLLQNYMMERILERVSVDNGLAGDVVLEAKTTQLAEQYIKDFGAVPLPTFGGGAQRLLIADEAAKNLFFSYLE